MTCERSSFQAPYLYSWRSSTFRYYRGAALNCRWIFINWGIALRSSLVIINTLHTSHTHTSQWLQQFVWKKSEELIESLYVRYFYINFSIIRYPYPVWKQIYTDPWKTNNLYPPIFQRIPIFQTRKNAWKFPRIVSARFPQYRLLAKPRSCTPTNSFVIINFSSEILSLMLAFTLLYRFFHRNWYWKMKVDF